jgi:hypothetical protein
MLATDGEIAAQTGEKLLCRFITRNKKKGPRIKKDALHSFPCGVYLQKKSAAKLMFFRSNAAA